MHKVKMAVVAAMMALSGEVLAQTPPAAPPPPDFSKVEIKTTDLGDDVYMLEGQGGNITLAVAKDGIIMVDGEFAPLHDKIKAAIALVSNQPINISSTPIFTATIPAATNPSRGMARPSSPRTTSRTGWPPEPPTA